MGNQDKDHRAESKATSAEGNTAQQESKRMAYLPPERRLELRNEIEAKPQQLRAAENYEITNLRQPEPDETN